MAQAKTHKNPTRKTTREKKDPKGANTTQARTKKLPSKATLRQLAKDWDHVT